MSLHNMVCVCVHLYRVYFYIGDGVFVNDTLTGDPLMTVPLFDDPNVSPDDPISKLCYEVHGEANASFNLISDECTSVSAFYQTASTASPNIDLNVVTQIGVRAVGNSDSCYNIQVNLDGACSATVNGDPATNNTFDGITVRQYPRSRRVRISVPNCADTMLVMWVFCRDGEVEDPVTWEYFDVSFIRYVVMRGLNLNEQSHGIIGNNCDSLLPGRLIYIYIVSVLQDNSGMCQSKSCLILDSSKGKKEMMTLISQFPRLTPMTPQEALWEGEVVLRGSLRRVHATMWATHKPASWVKWLTPTIQ